MSWRNLLNQGKIDRHQTSRKELDDLRAVVARAMPM